MSLQQLFTDIADAIREKDGTTETIQASTFPARISAIPSGGSTPSTPLDPQEVYNTTRPADWLPMPMPNENEIYLLFHIPDGVSSLIAFSVSHTGDCTVALGTVTNGVFVQQSTTNLSSSKYEAELSADNYGNLTNDGFKQVMIKVSGENITSWAKTSHSKKSNPTSFSNWNIVEIACNLPNCTRVECGDTSYDYRALSKLRYYTQYGTNKIVSTTNMFSYCRSLVAIPQLYTAMVTSMGAMFSNCRSLVAIPQLNTGKASGMSSMFSDCCSLTAIPELDTYNVTNASSMFSGCYSLAAIPSDMFLWSSNIKSMTSIFANCSSLIDVPVLNVTAVTDTIIDFSGCRSLSKVKVFSPSYTSTGKYALSFATCSLGHAAIVALFNSLPTITSASLKKAITLTGNPGVSELTEAEKRIATDKNWTLTL